MNNKDRIYVNSGQEITAFEFNEKVADVFSDMIKRSVPGYQNCIAMLAVIAKEYAKEGTNIYDLGCSLGAGILSLHSGLENRVCNLIGVDNSDAMLKRCDEILTSHLPEQSYELKHDDIQSTKIENASVVVLNFTLQFLPISSRREIIQRIYHGLNPEGVLVLSEKIKIDDVHSQQWQQLHEQFKRLNGYDEMEISAKRTALEKVLIPETSQEHLQRLRQSGFKNPVCWYQCLNFSSYMAVK